MPIAAIAARAVSTATIAAMTIPASIPSAAFIEAP
jgi:hypothetical protein